jgi:outer membrane lipoprotein LolB
VRHSARFAPVALVAALVSACATAPVVTPPGGVLPPNPDELSQWTAKGRLALTAQGEGGSGSFVWQQRSERTELAVRGPLGAGGLRVVTDGERLQVDDGSGQTIDGEAARAALEQRLGTRLPVGELRYWMLGVPAPDAQGLVQRATGSTSGFTQGEWVVSYEAFRQAGRWTLPARLTAVSAGTRVRIVVDDWQLPPEP